MAGGIDALSYGGHQRESECAPWRPHPSGFSALSGQAISNIENVVGGGGNDTLTGDDLANTLGGGGGNDTMTGGGGADTLTGVRATTPSWLASHGDDAYNGGAGIDTLDLT